MRRLLPITLAVMVLTLPGPAHPQTPADTSAPPAPFVLTVQDELISLSANNASLKAIIEEIGRRMNIPVAVHIPATARATLAFERLSLPETLKRLGRYVNYGYVEQWEHEALRIRAITVHSLKDPSRPDEPGGQPGGQTPLAKPLQIEIDPKQFLKPKQQ
jgi:hypothetical protein